MDPACTLPSAFSRRKTSRPLAAGAARSRDSQPGASLLRQHEDPSSARRFLRQNEARKGEAPIASFHQELLQGNKAADVRNATGPFAGAAAACGTRTCLCLSFRELLLLGAGGLFVSFTLSPGSVAARY